MRGLSSVVGCRHAAWRLPTATCCCLSFGLFLAPTQDAQPQNIMFKRAKDQLAQGALMSCPHFGSNMQVAGVQLIMQYLLVDIGLHTLDLACLLIETS